MARRLKVEDLQNTQDLDAAQMKRIVGGKSKKKQKKAGSVEPTKGSSEGKKGGGGKTEPIAGMFKSDGMLKIGGGEAKKASGDSGDGSKYSGKK